tara:strand:- start:2596 stop:4149 length:1554 start_codon:yes stop_codon:yes gene_type:complete
MNLVFAQEYMITEFGAKPDGLTLNTKAIQSAIDKVSKKGGGKIIFPSGEFLSGSIILKSNIELHFEKGAVLLGSTNPDNYGSQNTKALNSEKERVAPSRMALIVAHKVENIALTGAGTINGQGRKLAVTIDSLHHMGTRKVQNYNYRRMRPNEGSRPMLFAFTESKKITVTGLHLKNSACWGLFFERCSDMVLDRLKVTNRAFWNNDGMDITDCKNVKVTNCDLDTADDGICFKSHFPDYYNDNIFVSNCTIRSSASAVKFGTASHGGFKNITIENIKVFDTFRSAIAIESVDGGDIENIKVSNLIAENTGNAIFIRLGHRAGEKAGTIKKIHIKDVKVQMPFGRPDINYDVRGPEVDFFHNPFPSSIVGIPGHNVQDVILENIDISFPGRASKAMGYIPINDMGRVPEKIKDYPEFSMFGELPSWGFYIRHADGVTFKNVTINARDMDFRPAYVLDSAKNITIVDSDVIPMTQTHQLVLKDAENILISNLKVDGKTMKEVPIYGKSLHIEGIEALH